MRERERKEYCSKFCSKIDFVCLLLREQLTIIIIIFFCEKYCSLSSLFIDFS